MTINPAQLSAPIAGWQRGVVIAFAAAIGGLLLATWTTLFFVPVMYSWLRRRAPHPDPELEMV